MEIAVAIEAANTDAKAFKSAESTLKKLHSQAKRKETQPSFRCNQSGRSATACKFKEAECHTCGKKGHIVPACRSKNKGSVKPPNPPRQGKSSGKQHKAHQIHSKETTTEGDWWVFPTQARRELNPYLSVSHSK